VSFLAVIIRVPGLPRLGFANREKKRVFSRLSLVHSLQRHNELNLGRSLRKNTPTRSQHESSKYKTLDPRARMRNAHYKNAREAEEGRRVEGVSNTTGSGATSVPSRRTTSAPLCRLHSPSPLGPPRLRRSPTAYPPATTTPSASASTSTSTLASAPRPRRRCASPAVRLCLGVPAAPCLPALAALPDSVRVATPQHGRPNRRVLANDIAPGGHVDAHRKKALSEGLHPHEIAVVLQVLGEDTPPSHAQLGERLSHGRHNWHIMLGYQEARK